MQRAIWGMVLEPKMYEWSIMVNMVSGEGHHMEMGASCPHNTRTTYLDLAINHLRESVNTLTSDYYHEEQLVRK